jgi:transmembrane sensor
MSNILSQLDELIIKFLKGTLDSTEHIVLEKWIDASETNKQKFENLTDQKWVTAELSKIYEFDENAGWETIATSLNPNDGVSSMRQNWYRWIVAAVVIMALGTGYWSYLVKNTADELGKNLTQLQRFGKDIKAPVSSKAILILADGRKIVLEEASKGELVSEGDVVVTKSEDGQIIYKGKKENGSNAVIENVLSVPRGSKPVRLVLADGTEVWLNTGSSLTFPSKFVGVDRKVKMTGEVFFDVAKNPAKPFKVIANGIETKALGTQFNINAYVDEPMAKITLIEGSIKVERKKNSGEIENILVKPGQQVLLADHLKLMDSVNLDEVMAWKNGQFYFEGANTKTIMSQISRYYNVEVEHKDDIKYSFVMKIGRTVPVSELLKIMELTDLVHFKIDGNKITVTENNKK